MTLLRSDGLCVVVGHADSRETLAALPLYRQAGVPLVVTEATTVLLDDSMTGVFRIVPNDRTQARTAVQFAREKLKARSVALFYVQDEYGAGFARLFANEWDDGTAKLDATPFVDAADVETMAAAACERVEPDVVVLVARPAHVPRWISALERTCPGVRYVLTDSAQLDEDALTALGGAVERLYGIAHWHPSSSRAESRAFVEAFRRRHRRTPLPREALRHDGLSLAEAAIRNGGTDPEAVTRYPRSSVAAAPPTRASPARSRSVAARSGPSSSTAHPTPSSTRDHRGPRHLAQGAAADRRDRRLCRARRAGPAAAPGRRSPGRDAARARAPWRTSWTASPGCSRHRER